MNKTAILIVGTNEDQLARLKEGINEQPLWYGAFAIGDETAIERLLQSSYDVVVLTDGITNESTAKLKKIVALQQPGLIILQHYADATVSLTDTIEAVIAQQLNAAKPIFSFVDDALKNASLNIVIQ